MRLGALIDWGQIEHTFGAHFSSGRGRPALPSRLVAALLYLQHTFDASDEAVVNTWVENPYWQHFCGEVYLQTQAHKMQTPKHAPVFVRFFDEQVQAEAIGMLGTDAHAGFH